MDLDNSFAQFYQDVLESDIKDHFKDSLIKSSNENNQKIKTNILYLTNQCNLKCDYCYQLQDRKNSKVQFLNENDVKEFFDELCEREKDITSVVVLFGGEPFLNEKMFYYILDYCDEITIKTSKKFSLSTTTNGLYFLDEEKRNYFLQRIDKLKNSFSLEISFDGSGNDRRVYNNNISSTDDVKKVIKELKDKIPITIRYTIHKDNYKNALNDLVKLSKINFRKIVVNFYETELDKELGSSEETIKFKEYIKKRSQEIFLLTNMPICHLNCEVCKGCNHAVLKDNTINYRLKSSFEVEGNAGYFKHFSKNS